MLASAFAADHVVAIAPFAAHTNDADLAPFGAGLPDMLTSDLAPSPDITLVERSKLDAILDELDLQQSAWTDPATAARLGKVSGATEVLVGALSESQGTVRLDVRLVDVESATVRKTIDVEGPKADVFRLERLLAMDLLDSLEVEVPVAHRRRLKADAALQGDEVGLGFSENGVVLSVTGESRKTSELWVDGVNVGTLDKKGVVETKVVPGRHEVAYRVPGAQDERTERLRCWGVVEVGETGLSVGSKELCKQVRPGLSAFGSLLAEGTIVQHTDNSVGAYIDKRLLFPGTFLVESGVRTLWASSGPVEICRTPVTFAKGAAYLVTFAPQDCRATPMPLE